MNRSRYIAVNITRRLTYTYACSICARTTHYIYMHAYAYAHAYTSDDAYAGANANADATATAATAATATLGPHTSTTGHGRTHMPLPTLAAPLLNHTPFAQRSTPQQARRRTSTHWPLTSLAQATHAHQMRGPCRPFGRLAMTDGMDRCSGAPPLQLGRVTEARRDRAAGHITHARAA